MQKAHALLPRQCHAPLPKVEDVQDILRSLPEGQRLARLVTAMAQEIERLDEDNAQLRAAIKIYREVARVYGARSANGANRREPGSKGADARCLSGP
jgi:hypothetical protein